MHAMVHSQICGWVFSYHIHYTRSTHHIILFVHSQLRSYDTLRREHDTQIIQVALDAGIQITPEHWSVLLYGDETHTPHLQSIIADVSV